MGYRNLYPLLLAAAAVFAASSAASQDFPSRPIRFISPFAPGGATDTLGRTLAVPMERALGQNVIVENRPGGNTVIGAELVARAPADGYTLLLNSPTYTINPFVRSKLSYDAMTPERFNVFIRNEMERNAKIIKALNLRIE